MAYDGPPFGWTIPDGYTFDNIGRCSTCGAAIAWCYTKKGNRAPVDPTGISHFATCPNAADHRRPKPALAPEQGSRRTETPPAPAGVCHHSNLIIAATILRRDGTLGAYDAVYDLTCPIDGRVRRNTRLAATVHTLRHRYGWPIETIDRPGMLAEYRLTGPHGLMPEGGTR